MGTIFEQYTAMRLNLPVEFLLPPSSATSMLDQLDRGRDGIAEILDSFNKVNSEGATASVRVDEITVKSRIRTSVGFARVDAMVRESLVAWTTNTLRLRMNYVMQEISGEHAKTFAVRRRSSMSAVHSGAQRGSGYDEDSFIAASF